LEALGQIVDFLVEIETCSVGRVKTNTIRTGILGVGVVSNMVKLLVRDRETIQEAVRRFRKLVERSGIKKEMRRREFYEKPSEIKRRSRLRAERRSKRSHLLSNA
jgi:small subunit ribosomal protein S21